MYNDELKTLRAIINDYEHYFNKLFYDKVDGSTYKFLGILIAEDDYYYNMKDVDSGKPFLISCACRLSDICTLIDDNPMGDEYKEKFLELDERYEPLYGSILGNLNTKKLYRLCGMFIDTHMYYFHIQELDSYKYINIPYSEDFFKEYNLVEIIE